VSQGDLVVVLHRLASVANEMVDCCRVTLLFAPTTLLSYQYLGE
jgi:hypothetical protein